MAAKPIKSLELHYTMIQVLVIKSRPPYQLFFVNRHLFFFISDADYQPVHSLKAVIVNASTIVVSWEKPVDVTDPSIIEVCMSLH